MKDFRLLRADEIECRVAMIKSNGLSLLLYKDARCDMNILDETVGPMNWQRHHSRENANCSVAIYNEATKQWVEKEDTGTESYTEKEKGLASDSFKRACFNWGIGRELYTAPFIWIAADKAQIKANGQKMACNDKFTVQEIGYDGRKINKLVIFNETTKKVVYTFGQTQKKAESAKTESNSSTKSPQEQKILDEIKRTGVSAQSMLKFYSVKTIEELCKDEVKYKEALEKLNSMDTRRK